MNLTRELYQITKTSESRLVLTFADKIQVTKDDAVQLDLDCLALIPENNFVLVIEARNLNSSMTGDALKYLAQESKAKDNITCCAIILNNLPIRLIAKLYIRFYKPPYITKIFEKSLEADFWISEINAHNHNQDQIRI